MESSADENGICDVSMKLVLVCNEREVTIDVSARSSQVKNEEESAVEVVTCGIPLRRLLTSKSKR